MIKKEKQLYNLVRLKRELYKKMVSVAKYGESLSDVIENAFTGKYLKKVKKNDNK
jgi:predicted CopG family antitoxin